MSRETDQKRVVDSIIDEQLDAKQLAEEAYNDGVTESDRIMAMARRVHARVMSGSWTPARARAAMREGMANLMLMAYARLANKLVDLVDKHTEEQRKAIEDYGKPLKTIGMIRNVEMKARANERAGAVDKEGNLRGGK